MILTLDGWAERWAAAMGAVIWQSVLLVAAAALIAWLLRGSSPTVRYWLWQIVAVKLLLMPFWAVYVPLPDWTDRNVEPPTAAAPVAVTVEAPGSPVVSAPTIPEGEPGSGAASPTQSPWEPLSAVTWQTWLMLGWLAVVVAQLARLVRQRFRLARLLRQGTAAEADIAGPVAELAGRLGLRRVPAAVVVDADCPLFVCGAWRPRLVLPRRLMASLDPSQRRQVILHELAHVRRRDLAWGWPVEIARIVYFFHPVVYWVARQLRLERELACDQLAMSHSGHPPADYAQTLVRVVRHASEPAALQAAAIAAELTGNQPPKRESQPQDS